MRVAAVASGAVEATARSLFAHPNHAGVQLSALTALNSLLTYGEDGFAAGCDSALAQGALPSVLACLRHEEHSNHADTACVACEMLQKLVIESEAASAEAARMKAIPTLLSLIDRYVGVDDAANVLAHACLAGSLLSEHAKPVALECALASVRILLLHRSHRLAVLEALTHLCNALVADEEEGGRARRAATNVGLRGLAASFTQPRRI